MNLTTMALGGCAFLFGVLIAVLRWKRPHTLGTLLAMQKTLCVSAGSVVHALAYILMPLAGGAGLVVAGYWGVALL